MDLRYAERTYPAYHIGSNARPSFCACVKFGGSCITALAYGEPIVNVQFIKMRRKDTAWSTYYRWRISCYLRFIPLFREERARQEQETDAELARYSEITPFHDKRKERRLDKEDDEQIRKLRKPRMSDQMGRPPTYKSETSRRRKQLKIQISSINRWLDRPLKRTLTPEQATRRSVAAYEKRVGLESELALLTPDAVSV